MTHFIYIESNAFYQFLFCLGIEPVDVERVPSVFPSGLSLALTDVGVLLLFVLVPSGVIMLLLLGRILCPCCSDSQSPAAAQHSPIEVVDG